MIDDDALMPGQQATRHWRKSSYSGTAGNCIEVINLGPEAWAVRDSKDPIGPVLTFTANEWYAFTLTIKMSAGGSG